MDLPTNFFRAANNTNFSTQILDYAKEYLTTGNVPDAIDKKWLFRKKWDQFFLRNGKIFHRASRLEVVYPDDKEAVFRQFYNDPKTGMGKGVVKLLKSLRLKYMNFTRQDVIDFLKGEPVYHMAKRDPTKKTNRPYLAKRPNERWFMDLIDVSQYKGHNKKRRYILTVIDDHTRFAWARGIRRKLADHVLEAYRDILAEAGHQPKTQIHDNGGEFRGEFGDFLAQQDIIDRPVRSYTPTSNPVVESFNKILRDYIREGFIRHNDLNWIDHLQTYLENYNSTPHSRTKYPPVFLYTAVDLGDASTGLQKQVYKRAKKINRRNVAKNKTPELQIGDYVRVDLHVLYSALRQRRKAGEEKLTVVKFSPEIFTISEIVRPRKEGLAKNRYKLKKLDGTDFRNNQGNRYIFFASELKKVDKRAVSAITRKDALRLNLLDQNLQVDRNYNSNIHPPYPANRAFHIAAPQQPPPPAAPQPPPPPPPPNPPAVPRRRNRIVVAPTLASTRERRIIRKPVRYGFDD